MSRRGPSGTGVPRYPRLGFDGLPRDLPLSKGERNRVRRLVREEMHRRPREYAGLRQRPTAVLVAAIVGLVAVSSAIPLAFTFLRWPVGSRLPLLFVLPVIQVPIFVYLAHVMAWPAVCRALLAVGFEVCPRCGFALWNAGEDVGRCSECGAVRDGE